MSVISGHDNTDTKFLKPSEHNVLIQETNKLGDTRCIPIIFPTIYRSLPKSGAVKVRVRPTMLLISYPPPFWHQNLNTMSSTISRAPPLHPMQ
jgi:hypothetical protein